MAVNYFKKPFFLAALICATVFYSPLFKKNSEKEVHTVLNQKKITAIEGKIKSSPSKNSAGTYTADFELFYVQDENSATTEAEGVVKIYIPTAMAESYFPGKLYSASKSKKKFFFEKGEICIFEGVLKSGKFYVKNCRKCFFEETLFGKINRIRSLCRLQFMRIMYSWNDGGGLLLSLLCGVREYTKESTGNAFKRAGLSHILALSGMHLSMFSAIALFIGDRIKRKRVSTIIRISAVFVFVWFAGFSPSLERAFICSMTLIISEIAGCRKPDMLLVLSFSFLVQSIISPSHIQNAGFILSYAALAGILLTQKFFMIITSRFLPKIISSSLSSSLGAQTTTAPISLKMFGTFSPFGTIATIVVSPLVTVFIYSGLVLIILSMIFPFMQKPGGFFINFLYNIIEFTVGFFSRLPVISM